MGDRGRRRRRIPEAFRIGRRTRRDGVRLWTKPRAVDGPCRSGGQLAALDPPPPDGFADEDESFDDDDDESFDDDDDSFDDEDESFDGDDEDSFDVAAGALSFAAPEPFDEPSEEEAALRLSVR
jgi:hypothetical protein